MINHLILLLVLINSCIISKPILISEVTPYEIIQTQDNLLLGIQNKIKTRFNKSFMVGNADDLTDIITELDILFETKKHPLVSYWRAYGRYYSSIFHLKMGNKDKSEEVIDQGIDILKSIESKTSEDYALLVLLQGFSIQFKGMKAPFISSALKKNAEKAIKIDKKNLRAYYTLANNSFYTPKQWGGGSEVEENLIMAIGLPDQAVPNEYMPSWGKEESYELLIQHYVKMKEWNAAKKYFKEGSALYPNNYMIGQQASKLIDH